jgi:hypothetical protein
MYLGIGAGFGGLGVKYNTGTGGTITTSTNFGALTYSNNSGFCIQALATTTVAAAAAAPKKPRGHPPKK